MPLLTPQIIPAVFDATKLNANWVEIEASLLDLGPFVVSGLTVTAGAGLSVNVAAGTASIGGRVTVGSPITIAGLADNTTNHLFLLNTGSGQSNTSGTAPANSTKLGTCITAAGAVTSVQQGRNSGRQQFQQPQSLIPGGPATGITSAGHPASVNLGGWAAAAAEGVPVYGVLPPGGGGGNMIGTGTVAARPAPSLAGTEYLPSDGVEVFRDTGAAWAPWGPIWPLAEPVNGSFAWINQGGASVDTTKGGIFLDAPAAAGANARIRKITAPATPYNITVAFLPSMVADPAVFPAMGPLFRESGTGKFVTFAYTLATTVFARPQKWTNATTFSAGYTPTWDAIGNFQTGPLVWMRIKDDGANLTFWLSNDNRKWFQTFSVSRTDFMAGGPDEVGFYALANTASYDCSMWLLSWQVT